MIVDDESEKRTSSRQRSPNLAGFKSTFRKTEKDQFDLVLTDLKMPKIDGLVLIRRNVNRLTKTLHDLLSLSMVESGKTETSSEEFNLRKRFEMTALQIVRVA